MNKRFILLGASRGLGWATYQLLSKKMNDSFLLSSRKIKTRSEEVNQNTKLVEQDFSKVPVNVEFLAELQSFRPTNIVYFAGGGPYGHFADKKWSDHTWALNTTFMYPAELLHSVVAGKDKWPDLKQITIIGSAIAENQPDPKAASYAAAKHALRGLIETLKLEPIRIDIELFSPGYMQTDMLPPNSQPRQNNRAENPADVAKKLIKVIEKND